MLTREILKRSTWTGVQAAAAMAATAPVLDLQLIQSVIVTALATLLAAIKTAVVETTSGT